MKEQMLEEGIKLFKNSKMANSKMNELKMKYSKTPKLTTEEKKALKTIINFFEKTIKNLDKMEKKFLNETDKEEKEKIKKQYKKEVKKYKKEFDKAWGINRWSIIFGGPLFPSVLIMSIGSAIFSPVIGFAAAMYTYKKAVKSGVEKYDREKTLKEEILNLCK